MEQNIEPLVVFLSACGVSALAGLAALLRSQKKITLLSVFSALLNSGLLGLGISLLWYAKFRDNIYFLVGVCVVAGLGGMTTVDMVLDQIKKSGISLRIGKDTSPIETDTEKTNTET